jgi:hypothetical protein
LDQEINEMKISPQPRRNLFRSTATTVYSAFSLAYGAVKKYDSTATTISCVADDDVSEDSKEDTITAEGTAVTEMECYQGDGHTPRNYGDALHLGNFEQHVDKVEGSCSRKEWAAARDEFDSIVEYPKSFVGTPRRQVTGEDHQQVLDIDKYATIIDCKHQDAMVAMKSPRSIFDNDEFDTMEAALEGRAPPPKPEIGEKLRPTVERVHS